MESLRYGEKKSEPKFLKGVIGSDGKYTSSQSEDPPAHKHSARLMLTSL